MPFPRFARLASEKRERLLVVAAQEFATHGYADASINRILERAEMSKGAAYYYFADKLDLFGAVATYCLHELRLVAQTPDPATLTAATFWPTFATLHRQPLLASLERPWLFRALRVAGRLPPEGMAREPLATLATQLRGMVRALIQRGQALGVIRADLPDELLFAWLDALDDASDYWLLARWE
ncbi:MAG TPA: TetR/AcrR family transcriptional regulator, partial [Ktedonobacterales bacterium]|nr:TetR/AcrR family transcriptional regulator [Ktedonobacterales bacterium]